MTKEIIISGNCYLGVYKIYPDGRVFNININRFISLQKSTQGYLLLEFYVKGKRERIFVHRLVATCYIPNPDNKPQINHKNGIKSDNRVENLEWCTPQENITHARKTGLYLTEKNLLNYSKRKGKKPFQLVGCSVSGKDNAKTIPCYLFDSNKVLIREFESQNLCAKHIKSRQGNLYRSLNDGTKCKGYYVSVNPIYGK